MNRQRKTINIGKRESIRRPLPGIWSLGPTYDTRQPRTIQQHTTHHSGTFARDRATSFLTEPTQQTINEVCIHSDGRHPLNTQHINNQHATTVDAQHARTHKIKQAHATNSHTQRHKPKKSTHRRAKTRNNQPTYAWAPKSILKNNDHHGGTFARDRATSFPPNQAFRNQAISCNGTTWQVTSLHVVTQSRISCYLFHHITWLS